MRYCELCDKEKPRHSFERVQDKRGSSMWVCGACYENKCDPCQMCGEMHEHAGLNNGLCVKCQPGFLDDLADEHQWNEMKRKRLER